MDLVLKALSVSLKSGSCFATVWLLKTRTAPEREPSIGLIDKSHGTLEGIIIHSPISAQRWNPHLRTQHKCRLHILSRKHILEGEAYLTFVIWKVLNPRLLSLKWYCCHLKVCTRHEDVHHVTPNFPPIITLYSFNNKLRLTQPLNNLYL